MSDEPLTRNAVATLHYKTGRAAIRAANPLIQILLLLQQGTRLFVTICQITHFVNERKTELILKVYILRPQRTVLRPPPAGRTGNILMHYFNLQIPYGPFHINKDILTCSLEVET